MMLFCLFSLIAVALSQPQQSAPWWKDLLESSFTNNFAIDSVCGQTHFTCDAVDLVTNVHITCDLSSSPSPLNGALLAQADRLQTLSLHSCCKFPGFMLPSEIALLPSFTKLEVLECHNLTSSSTIPTEYSSMVALKELSISRDAAGMTGGLSLFGSLPEFPVLPASLEVLRVEGTHVTGTIPSSYGLLSSLHTLRLSHNSLSGTIPSELALLEGNGTNLRIQLDQNSLSGTIPSEFSSSTISYYTFYVDQNNLTGSIVDISSSPQAYSGCSWLVLGPGQQSNCFLPCTNYSLLSSCNLWKLGSAADEPCTFEQTCTPLPTSSPTTSPVLAPSRSPSIEPTRAPSLAPSASPTSAPTPVPPTDTIKTPGTEDENEAAKKMREQVASDIIQGLIPIFISVGVGIILVVLLVGCLAVHFSRRKTVSKSTKVSTDSRLSESERNSFKRSSRSGYTSRRRSQHLSSPTRRSGQLNNSSVPEKSGSDVAYDPTYIGARLNSLYERVNMPSEPNTYESMESPLASVNYNTSPIPLNASDYDKASLPAAGSSEYIGLTNSMVHNPAQAKGYADFTASMMKPRAATAGYNDFTQSMLKPQQNTYNDLSPSLLKTNARARAGSASRNRSRPNSRERSRANSRERSNSGSSGGDKRHLSPSIPESPRSGNSGGYADVSTMLNRGKTEIRYNELRPDFVKTEARTTPKRPW